MKNNTQYVLILGIVAFLMLGMAQIRLFEHRMIVDSAVSAFVICNTQSFDIAEKRIAIGINQVLPVIATYFTSDVKWIVTAYYVNDYLWYLGFFILFLFVLKQPFAALALLIGYFTNIGYNYFILPYTVPILWPLLILTILILRQQTLTKKPWLSTLIVAISLFFLAFSNPVNTITTSIFLVYFFIEQWQKGKELWQYKASAAFFILLVIIKNINPDPYDINRVNDFRFEQLFHLDFLARAVWLSDFIITYPLGLFLLIAGLVMGISKFRKGYKLQALVIGGSFMYLTVVFLAYGLPARAAFDDLVAKAMAPLLLLFSFLLSEHLIHYTLPKRPYAYYTSLGLFALLFSIKMAFLFSHYTEIPNTKLAVCKTLIEQAPNNGSKYYVDISNLPELEGLALNSMEVIIHSALTSEKPYDMHIVVADSIELEEVLQVDDQAIYHMPGNSYTLEDEMGFFNFNLEEDWEEIIPQPAEEDVAVAQ